MSLDDQLDRLPPPEPLGQGCARILFAALLATAVLSTVWLLWAR